MDDNVIFIGRSDDNDIIYTDHTVSRRHAQIMRIDQGNFVIQNLSTNNGTLVNGQLISSAISVSIKDKIQLGNQILDWNDVLSVFNKRLISDDKVPVSENVEGSSRFLKVFGLLLASIFVVFVGVEFWNRDTKKIDAPIDVTSDTLSANDTIKKTEVLEEKQLGEAQNHENSSENPKAKYQRKKNPIVYSISCLRNKSDLNAIIGLGADVEYGWITFSCDEVGVDEEIEVGEKLKEQVEVDYRYSHDASLKSRIQMIFTNLLKALKNPRMSYQVYIIKSDEINAFTAGGYVFITTGIINFAENDDEIACVLAHEIYHNELGHINLILRKEKAARNWLGDFADWGLVASKILGASFNQENEVYCDMYGVDLAIQAGYDGKAATAFWKRMKSNGNGMTKIFSTHPFSNERMNCVHEHLERNYE